MNEPIKIEVKYEPKDYWCLYSRYYFGENRLFFPFFGFLIFANLLVLIFTSNISKINWLSVVLVTAVYTLIWAAVQLYYAVEYAKKQILQECSYTFSNANVEVKADYFSSRIDWNYFASVKETSSLFYLYKKDGHPLHIPKRCFQAEDLIEFRALLKTKLGENANLKEAKNTLGLR